MREKTQSYIEKISVDFSKMEKPELINYIEFMLKHLRYTDAFWYLFVEERFGSDSAVGINEKVWTTMGKIITRDIKEKFNVHEKGLEGFLKIQKYHYWTIITGYNVEKSDDELFITIPHCPPQEARLNKGMKEFNCKKMHLMEFEAMAKEIDERIQVDCVFAPPDPHPAEMFCKWRITLKR